MSTMDELIAWLRTTIEGDLAAARSLGDHAWRVDDEGCGWFFISQDEGGDPLAKSCGCCSVGTLTREQAEHIVLQQPPHTIARCEAELRIIALHEDMHEGPCVTSYDYPQPPCMELRLLAYGYRNRPGWQEGWAP